MQFAFLAGRRGSDNVIIAQELIHSLKNRGGREGFMVVKIDLEKAYDKLEWSFIKMVLDHFGFPPKHCQHDYKLCDVYINNNSV